MDLLSGPFAFWRLGTDRQSCRLAVEPCLPDGIFVLGGLCGNFLPSRPSIGAFECRARLRITLLWLASRHRHCLLRLDYTFRSKPRKCLHLLQILLAALLGYFCALELVTRTAFPRINHIWRSFQANQFHAVSLRPDAPSNSLTMLIVGNSYLEVGVNRDSLQQEIAPNYSLAYLPMSGTSYLDWYFGLRRLFAEGSHPAIVGVCLSTRDLLSDSTYGGSFANALMLEGDILQVKRESHLDNTTMTDYFFANSSSWMGHRGEIHNWLLRKTAPQIDDLVTYFKPKNRPLPPASDVLGKALPRLRLLNDLC